MNRRTFFNTALSAVGVIALARVLKVEDVFARAKKGKHAASGGKGVQATEESLKGLPNAPADLTAKNFWEQGDKIATVQNYCDAAKPGNKACGQKRQPGQFCGNCTFLQERVNYKGDVAGKCQLIPPQGSKTHVHGHTYCASYVANAANHYDIKKG